MCIFRVNLPASGAPIVAHGGLSHWTSTALFYATKSRNKWLLRLVTRQSSDSWAMIPMPTTFVACPYTPRYCLGQWRVLVCLVSNPLLNKQIGPYYSALLRGNRRGQPCLFCDRGFVCCWPFRIFSEMSTLRFPPDVIRAQREKKLFDATSDPRSYSAAEIDSISDRLINVWRHGSHRTSRVVSTNYGGNF